MHSIEKLIVQDAGNKIRILLRLVCKMCQHERLLNCEARSVCYPCGCFLYFIPFYSVDDHSGSVAETLRDINLSRLSSRVQSFL